MHCDISGHAGLGLEIAGGDPVLVECAIMECGDIGLLTHSGGRGRLSRCRIENNAEDGYAVRDGCQPILEDCRFRAR